MWKLVTGACSVKKAAVMSSFLFMHHQSVKLHFGKMDYVFQALWRPRDDTWTCCIRCIPSDFLATPPVGNLFICHIAFSLKERHKFVNRLLGKLYWAWTNNWCILPLVLVVVSSPTFTTNPKYRSLGWHHLQGGTLQGLNGIQHQGLWHQLPLGRHSNGKTHGWTKKSRTAWGNYIKKNIYIYVIFLSVGLWVALSVHAMFKWENDVQQWLRECNSYMVLQRMELL